MGSIGFVLKVGILVLSLKYLLKTSKVLNATFFYAGSILVIGILFNLGSFNPVLLIVLVLAFLYDMATGFLYFWLIDRVQHSYALFYLVMVGGIVANYLLKFGIASVFS
jgi:hypothetical protein